MQTFEGVYRLVGNFLCKNRKKNLTYKYFTLFDK